nr:MAG TPA: hypothetical protein [Caudoviricetes sp.]
MSTSLVASCEIRSALKKADSLYMWKTLKNGGGFLMS